MSPVDTVGTPEVSLILPGELTPQALYDKCCGPGPQPVVELAPGSHQPLPRPRPDPLAAARPQPDRAAPRVHARAAGSTGRRVGALQPHQPRLSPAEGIPGQHADRGPRPTPACSGASPVAYFSAEFGIHESVPIYSGGLGVLSGDHIKSASGLGVPLVAIGLFYDQGYFKQHLDDNG